MKKIVSLVLAAAVAVTGSLAFAKGGPDYKEVKIYSMNPYATETFTKLKADLNAENVVIKRSDKAEDVNISITGASNYASKNPLVNGNPKTKTVEIIQKDKIKGLKDRSVVITVIVPQNFRFADVSIKTTGTVQITNCAFGNLNMDCSTGKILLDTVEADSLSGSISTGSLVYKKITGTKASASVDGGNIEVSNVDVKNLNLKLTKANAKIEGVKIGKGFNLSADKGSTELALTEFPESGSTFEVGSGELKIKLPSKSVFWTTGTVDPKGHFISDWPQDSKGPVVNVKVGAGGTLHLTK